MKFVIQRVTNAKCEVEGNITGQIDLGFCVLIGVAENDTESIADKMLRKLLGMRIFADADGKTNLALKDVNGSLLLISQFTLYANCRKGNRPYEYIIEECRKQILNVQTGIFGADMKISLTNDGPFTIILDSDDLA